MARHATKRSPKGTKKPTKTAKKTRTKRVERVLAFSTEVPGSEDPRQLDIPGTEGQRRVRPQSHYVTIYMTDESRSEVEKVRNAIGSIFYRPTLSETIFRAVELGLPLLLAQHTSKHRVVQRAVEDMKRQDSQS